MGMMLFDMHSHILPGFDDGASNEQESVALLKQASQQGIKAMVCSSHYYPQETVQSFLERRKSSVEQLKKVLASVDFVLPKLYLGAEAAWFPGMTHLDHVEKLCIAKTSYMLIEPPFELWTESFFQDLYSFRNVLGITPIIAHLERYLDLQDKKRIQRLLDMDVVIQMNAGCIISPKTSGIAKKMLKKGYVQLLGSDCHRINGRPENLGEVVSYFEKWKMSEVLDQICSNSMKILKFEG